MLPFAFNPLFIEIMTLAELFFKKPKVFQSSFHRVVTLLTDRTATDPYFQSSFHRVEWFEKIGLEKEKATFNPLFIERKKKFSEATE